MNALTVVKRAARITAATVGIGVFGILMLDAFLPGVGGNVSTHHYSSPAARDRALRYYFATHKSTTKKTSKTVTIGNTKITYKYGGYQVSTPTATVSYYQYTYGHGLRTTPYETFSDYVGGKTHTTYIPDTSGNTPSHSVAQDFKSSIRKYHVSMPDATTMHVNMNTSNTSFQSMAGHSQGWK